MTILDASSPPPKTPPRRLRLLLVMVAVIAVVVILLLPELVPGVPWGTHETCLKGAEVDQEVVDTPQVAVDTPYLGRADINLTSGSYTFASGGLVLNTSMVLSPPGTTSESEWMEWDEGNGSADVTSYVNLTWVIDSVQNGTVSGSGPATPCTAPFVAQPISGWGVIAVGFPWQGPGNTSDSSVPREDPGLNSSWSSGTVVPALVDLTVETPTLRSFSNCNTTVNETFPEAVGALSWVTLSVGIPFTFDGRTHVVWGSLQWTGTGNTTNAVTYSVAGTGTWNIGSTGPNGTGLYTFDYRACP